MSASGSATPATSVNGAYEFALEIREDAGNYIGAQTVPIFPATNAPFQWRFILLDYREVGQQWYSSWERFANDTTWSLEFYYATPTKTVVPASSTTIGYQLDGQVPFLKSSTVLRGSSQNGGFTASDPLVFDFNPTAALVTSGATYGRLVLRLETAGSRGGMAYADWRQYTALTQRHFTYTYQNPYNNVGVLTTVNQAPLPFYVKFDPTFTNFGYVKTLSTPTTNLATATIVSSSLSKTTSQVLSASLNASVTVSSAAISVTSGPVEPSVPAKVSSLTVTYKAVITFPYADFASYPLSLQKVSNDGWDNTLGPILPLCDNLTVNLQVFTRNSMGDGPLMSTTWDQETWTLDLLTLTDPPNTSSTVSAQQFSVGSASLSIDPIGSQNGSGGYYSELYYLNTLTFNLTKASTQHTKASLKYGVLSLRSISSSPLQQHIWLLKQSSFARVEYRGNPSFVQSLWPAPTLIFDRQYGGVGKVYLAANVEATASVVSAQTSDFAKPLSASLASTATPQTRLTADFTIASTAQTSTTYSASLGRLINLQPVESPFVIRLTSTAVFWSVLLEASVVVTAISETDARQYTPALLSCNSVVEAVFLDYKLSLEPKSLLRIPLSSIPALSSSEVSGVNADIRKVYLALADLIYTSYHNKPVSDRPNQFTADRDTSFFNGVLERSYKFDFGLELNQTEVLQEP
jgi:hypothetical protein